ncbi:DUF2474 domain-containing protein [Kordiimonas gwangyangensis]|nr:DUF2474 domain-containing protein [Kordiimonas gwangyangensis]
MAELPEKNTPLWRRLLWFAAIWGGSVLALTVVAGVIRWAVMPGP